MKSMFIKIQYALLLLLTVNVFGQREKQMTQTPQVTQITNDPDWQIILSNNTDFFNRLARQPNSLSEIWAAGPDNFLSQLNYTREEYYQKRMETRDAAVRLMNKFPDLNSFGACTGCRLSEKELTGKVDQFLMGLRSQRGIDAGSYLREIDSDEGGFGPKCGWKFYACATICAATIEFFPAYLACCAICLCEYCRNPPAWCN